jgi:5'(3')-deoxyribonucleotidase
MPSDKGEVVIGVDLDGVCADFYARMREVAAEWFEVPIDGLTNTPSYGLGEWGVDSKEEYERLHRFAVTQRELFATAPMITGTRRVLQKLSKEGYRVRILTHRLFIQFFHETAVRQTITWLDRNGIPYWDLCFMKEKDQVGADVYIDDATHNIQKLRESGHYAICFANSTNGSADNPRANGWDEVYELIKVRHPAPTAQMGAMQGSGPKSKQRVRTKRAAIMK